MALKVSTREDWGCPPTTVRYDVSPQGMTLHWPGPGRFRFANHADCLRQVRAWDAMHRAKGSIMLEYNGLVCQHGYYIEGRARWGRLIARPGSNGTAYANSVRLSLQFMAGTFDAPPSELEQSWMGEVIARARAQGAGSIIDNHQAWYATDCAGNAIRAAIPNIARYASGTVAPSEGFLMALTDKQQDELYAWVKAVKEGVFDGGTSMPQGLPLKDLVQNWGSAINARVTSIDLELDTVRAENAALQAALEAVSGGSVDTAAVTAAIEKAVRESLANLELVLKAQGGETPPAPVDPAPVEPAPFV